MTDIVERLRTWCHAVDAESAQDLMDEAANEIERLRNGAACPHVRGTVTQHCSLNFTLTDEERVAIEESIRQNLESDCISTEKAQETNATLHSLLERLRS